ncbi:MAG TPA: alpha/beta fold hydrolase [Bacteroidales bacterium]|nr:alpha/beta fold hydrolase [Bacteroidales bacterium]
MRRLSYITGLFLISVCLLTCHSENSSLLYYINSKGKSVKVKNQAAWEIKYQQILDSMQLVMGPLHENAGQRTSEIQNLEDTILNGIRRVKLLFAVENNDLVPAYLMIPESIATPVPGILCLHQTTDIGKGEPAGIGGNQNLHYALELAERGYVTIAPDYPNFGDYHFDPYSNGYISATMKGICNHMAAIDLLQSLPQVDPERIGCIGHSLGGHNSLFVAAFDKRIKAVVTSCGFTSFHKYYNGNLKGWSHRGYMPLIESVYKTDPSKMPFDFPEVLAVIAPRAIFINAPLNDSNFDVSGVRNCVDAVLPVYDLYGCSDKIILKTPDAPHDFPAVIRKEAYMFLDRELKISDNSK